MAEVVASDVLNPEVCVICLGNLTEQALALPCKHSQFDFGCLCTWLNQQRVCPLCKGSITAVKYDLKIDGGTIFSLPTLKHSTTSGYLRHNRQHPYYDTSHHRSRQIHRLSNNPAATRTRDQHDVQVPMSSADPAIAFRQSIYRTQKYSLRVGSNRISRYQNLAPSSFASNQGLVKRAKTWIRRELSAFDLLKLDLPSCGRNERRASNAEFLLEYIVSILKSIDLRGSSGQAESLLKDFLGRESARLFLHELESFLRSPYESLEDWDMHVQYIESDTGAMAVAMGSHEREQSGAS